MSRRPAHLELTGGKGPRQRVWEAIISRAMGTEFALLDVLGNDINRSTAISYLKSLEKAGYIKRTRINGREPDGQYRKAAWVLIRDNGIEAPRLDKQGNPVLIGRGVENMWHTIRHFLEDFDFRELGSHASTPAHPVSPETAKAWIKNINAAGYLIETKPAKPGAKATPARYRLDPAMNTGPRPPMIQRCKTVYDPNLGRIVWQEQPDWEAV